MLKIEINKNMANTKNYWMNIINDKYLGRGVYIDFDTTKEIDAVLNILGTTHKLDITNHVRGDWYDNA